MLPAREQLARAERAFNRLARKGATDEDYDDILCFVMHCWHVKDWIRNDLTLSPEIRKRVEDDALAQRNLKICAQVCNRTKHLAKRKKHAEITVKYIEAHDGCDDTPASATYGVTLDDGSTHDAHQIAADALEEWRKLFADYGI